MQNKKNRFQAGFTIIELIVVIAIIAVLAAIVLINVTGYINKGKDSAIKGNLTSLMSDAAVAFDSADAAYNGDNGVCTKYFPAINAAIAGAGGTATCAANSTQWCASSTLKVDSSNFFCVDYTGKKIEGAAATCNATTYTCP